MHVTACAHGARTSTNGARTAGFGSLVFEETVKYDTDKLTVVEDKHWVVDSNIFQTFVGALVIVNVVCMGIEADYPELTTLWDISENIFTAGFLAEMIVKFVVFRLGYFADRSNWLDFTLVICAVVDTWIIRALGAAEVDLQSLSVLRILRMSRLVRVLRLFAYFRPLVVVISGVVGAIRTTFWAALVLTLVIYVYAIFCVNMVGKGDARTQYAGYTQDADDINSTDMMVEFNPYIHFGSISRSMLTLFNMAILAEWYEIARPILLVQPYVLCALIFFVVFVTFGVMNVIIGMIVDSVMQNIRAMEKEDKEQVRQRKLSILAEVQNILYSMDRDSDGRVTLQELARGMEAGLCKKLLDDIGLPQGYTPAELLQMLDHDGSGVLEYDEFVRSFYRLIDCNDFQRDCLRQMSANETKYCVNKLHQIVSDGLEQIHVLVSNVGETVGHTFSPADQFHGLHTSSAGCPSPRFSMFSAEHLAGEISLVPDRLGRKQLRATANDSVTSWEPLPPRELEEAKRLPLPPRGVEETTCLGSLRDQSNVEHSGGSATCDHLHLVKIFEMAQRQDIEGLFSTVKAIESEALSAISSRLEAWHSNLESTIQQSIRDKLNVCSCLAAVKKKDLIELSGCRVPTRTKEDADAGTPDVGGEHGTSKYLVDRTCYCNGASAISTACISGDSSPRGHTASFRTL